MIQRVQSIFLLIATIIPIVLIFIPFGYVDTEMARYVYNSISLKEMIPDGALLLGFLSRADIRLELLRDIPLQEPYQANADSLVHDDCLPD